MAGRPRKPTAKHVAEGTFRADRHGERSDIHVRPGMPEKPNSLPKDASDLWDTILENLPEEVWNKCDKAMLEGCCRWWAVYRLCIDAMDLKEAQRAWNCFMSSAGQLGLSPTARAKLQAPPPKEVDELDQLANLRVTG